MTDHARRNNLMNPFGKPKKTAIFANRSLPVCRTLISARKVRATQSAILLNEKLSARVE